MPELRQNLITGEWVIIATERSKRPSDFSLKPDVRKGGKCPFCPGNESETPPELASFRSPGTMPDQPGWWIRVVPNKFAALGAGGSTAADSGDYHTLPGEGAHEVLIESPDHDATLANLPQNQIEEIFRCWRDRYLALLQNKRIRYIQIFKNQGSVAGASLEHTHSQIIATPLIPPVVTAELHGAEHYFNDRGECPFCHMINYELRQQVRTVAENGEFLAICPFASRFPFETWILPRHHHPSFGSIDERLINGLSQIIKETLQKIDMSLQSPPYNLVLHSAPKGYETASFYHWHLEFLPRLTTVAGFEWGTGIYINPTVPETAANYLRYTSLEKPH